MPQCLAKIYSRRLEDRTRSLEIVDREKHWKLVPALGPIQSPEGLRISWNADEGKSARGWKSPSLGPGSFLHGNAEIGQKMERFQAILAICSANFSAVNRFQLSAKLSKCQEIQQNSPNFEEGSSSIHPFHRFNSADYDRLCNAKASGREHVIRHGHRFSVQLPTVRAILGECWSRVPGDVKRNSCHLHPPSSILIHPYSSLSILIHLCLSSSIFILSL